MSQAELYGWPSPAEVHDKPNDKQNQKNEEQDFSDSGGRERNPSEAKNPRNDRDNEKDQRVPQHRSTPFPLV
jgi:hypothetical protein